MSDHFESFFSKFSSSISYASAGSAFLSALNSAWLWALVGGLCAVFTAWSNHHHNRKKYELEKKKAELLGVVVNSNNAEL